MRSEAMMTEHRKSDHVRLIDGRLCPVIIADHERGTPFRRIGARTPVFMRVL
jgi:hypothetical protein